MVQEAVRFANASDLDAAEELLAASAELCPAASAPFRELAGIRFRHSEWGEADGNYSAYSPDLPGCVATGDTREDAERNMLEVIDMHLEGLKEDKLPIPEAPRSRRWW